ncbi:MAG: GtrA family protein [Clostridia bacterium]|nr:GtrA family protein [Clostridia bacterium]
MDFVKRMREDAAYRKHIITYFAFGIITTLVSWGSFWLLRRFAPFIEENIANIISIILAVITSYVVNRKFVFKSKEPNIWKEFLMFCSGRVVTMIFEEVAFFVLATVIGINEMLVKIGVSVIVVILNYIFSKIFVFKNSKEG